MRKFLYAFFLRFYHIVGWITRKIKPYQKEVRRPEVAPRCVENHYEPKRKFRWLFKFDDDTIPQFVLKRTQRPSVGVEQGKGTTWLSIYDPVVPSSSHKVYEWLQDPQPKDASLKLLDPVGCVIEEWQYKGLRPRRADFGNIDYSDGEACDIFIDLSYDSVKLLPKDGPIEVLSDEELLCQ